MNRKGESKGACCDKNDDNLVQEVSPRALPMMTKMPTADEIINGIKTLANEDD